MLNQARSTERRTVALLAAVNLVTLGSLAAPVVAGIPLKIAAIFGEGERASALAFVLALGGVAALIANPVFGALSDRTRCRLGRRRPWMLGGAIAGFFCVLAFSVADSFAAITISWVCAQLAFNATFAASTALLADSLPEPKRAAASGVFTAAAFVGTLPPLLLAALVPTRIDLVVMVMPVCALVVVGAAMSIREYKPHEITPVQHKAAAHGRVSITFAFAAVWLQRLAMQSAFSLATAFTLYLIVDRITKSAVTATPIAMTATLIGGAGIVFGAAVGGAWASRRQRYLPFLVFGAVGLAAGASLRSIADAPEVLWLATGVGGTAVGVYLAVNLALAMRIVPQDRAGTYLGVLNVAETIPQVLAPIAAAALLHAGSADPISGATDNYALLYGAAAIVALLSLATLPALRRAARQPHAVASDLLAEATLGVGHN